MKKRCLLILALIASPHLNAQLLYTPDERPTQKSNKSNIDLAVDAFHRSCPKILNEYQGDISSINIEHKKFNNNPDYCADFRCRELHWKEMVTVVIKVKPNPTKLNKKYAKHTLRFNLGSGIKTGVVTSKYPEICGVEKNQSSYTFWAIDELKEIFN